VQPDRIMRGIIVMNHYFIGTRYCRAIVRSAGRPVAAERVSLTVCASSNNRVSSNRVSIPYVVSVRWAGLAVNG
jgi:hypothetical protein